MFEPPVFVIEVAGADPKFGGKRHLEIQQSHDDEVEGIVRLCGRETCPYCGNEVKLTLNDLRRLRSFGIDHAIKLMEATDD